MADKKTDKKSHRRVSLGSKYIRPIRQQNKRRGFHDSDSDFDEPDLPPESFSPLSPYQPPQSPPPLSEELKSQTET
jgi:hypothetical protein